MVRMISDMDLRHDLPSSGRLVENLSPAFQINSVSPVFFQHFAQFRRSEARRNVVLFTLSETATVRKKFYPIYFSEFSARAQIQLGLVEIPVPLPRP